MNCIKIKKRNDFILTLSKICYKLHLNLFGRLISKKRVLYSFNFLEKAASQLLYTNYDFSHLESIDSYNSPIFVMWLQGGEDVMPETVKRCFQSIKQNCPTHPVNLVTEANLSSYIDLPPVILQKYSEKKISRSSFSDIVRSALLYKYGGTWIDSTVYLSAKLPDEYFNKDFFSPCGFIGIKKRDWKYFFIECNGWSTWFMGTNKKHYPLFDFLTNIYAFYFEKYDSIIDYFQTDFSISLFYQKNSNFHEYLNSQKANNVRAYDLADFMNKEIDSEQEKLKKLLRENYIHKLTYKRNWIKTNKKNKKTVYSLFLQDFKKE